MKNTTLRLVWLTLLSMLAFTAVAIFTENMPLIFSMLLMSMILLPMVIYRVLRDGYEAQRRLINVDSRK